MENSTPQTTPPTPPVVETKVSVHPIETKPQPNFLTAGLVILSLVLLGTSAFLGYQNMNLNKQISEMKTTQVTTTNSPTPVVTVNPTANWRTYTNTNAGISFKYPFELTESQAGISGPLSKQADLVTTFAISSSIQQNSDAPFDGFAIYEQDPGLLKGDFNDYLQTELESVKNGIAFQNPDATIKTAQFGNNTFSYINSETSIIRYFLLSPDSKRIVIFSRLNSTEDFLKTFDQILSTFKFTN